MSLCNLNQQLCEYMCQMCLSQQKAASASVYLTPTDNIFLQSTDPALRPSGSSTRLSSLSVLTRLRTPSPHHLHYQSKGWTHLQYMLPLGQIIHRRILLLLTHKSLHALTPGPALFLRPSPHQETLPETPLLHHHSAFRITSRMWMMSRAQNQATADGNVHGPCSINQTKTPSLLNLWYSSNHYSRAFCSSWLSTLPTDCSGLYFFWFCVLISRYYYSFVDNNIIIIVIRYYYY